MNRDAHLLLPASPKASTPKVLCNSLFGRYLLCFGIYADKSSAILLRRQEGREPTIEERAAAFRNLPINTDGFV
jgi:hypothetical protein